MENTPKCPVHQKEMRSGQYGYYCPTKLDDGSWCKWAAKMDGNVYEKAPKGQNFGSGGSSARGMAPSRSNVDWDRLGKIKALCGMANALLSAGKNVADIIPMLPSLEALVAAIETRGSAGKPEPVIHVEDSDIPF